MHFSSLASGSRGNACLIRLSGLGLLIDVGLNPPTLIERLSAVDSSLEQVAAAVLTHTHLDHVSSPTLRLLARRRVPLLCHEAHRAELVGNEGFRQLESLGLVRAYDDRPWLGPGGIRIEPVPLSHDDRPTYGFRIEARDRRREPLRSVGYLADLGTWNDAHADAMADVNVLAVEFNHDVLLERQSGRPGYLVARNLGDGGHLSNEQAAALVARVLGRSRPGRMHALVLLHLSQDCNRPDLAYRAAVDALRRANRRVPIHIADQFSASPHLCIALRRPRVECAPPPTAVRSRQPVPARSQTWLTFS
jgi:phosphoribosyl 1,2-cyclic phosphodiesterase